MLLEPTRILGRRLEIAVDAPLVVAFSGGGDSLALLLIAKTWADTAGRRLVAVTVDHQLQVAGARWAEWCAERARRLGVEHRIVAWRGPKPASGLPAAARRARHALLAETARSECAAVILMGHTADDGIEAAAMRAAGSTTPTPREWTPSPAWPQGRGIFLLRPLLAARRAALRDWLRLQGETWIDDPANEDVRFARARTRRDLPGDPLVAPVCGPRRKLAHAGDVSEGEAELIIRRAAFSDPDRDGRSLLAVALLCASGTDRPPRGARLERLLGALRDDAPLIATLAGARVEADGGRVRVMREPGEFRRLGARELRLAPGRPSVWDGRFEIETDHADLVVRPLAGLASRLPKAEARALRAVHATARATLPALVDQSGQVTCPILAGGGQTRIRALVMGRLCAALGAIKDEATIGAWRKPVGRPKLGS